MRQRATFCSILLTLTVLAGTSTAQSNLGRIVGTVRDSSGAIVPDVKVTVANEGTGLVREFHSTATGNYEVPNLVPGLYRVEAQHTGFKHFLRQGVPLDTGRTVRVDIDLEVGRRPGHPDAPAPDVVNQPAA